MATNSFLDGYSIGVYPGSWRERDRYYILFKVNAWNSCSLLNCW